jgi:hypothetical protein
MNAPTNITTDQLTKLDSLITAAYAARDEARRGMLFASRAGLALTNAAFEIFECEGLYDIREDIAHELGVEPISSERRAA